MQRFLLKSIRTDEFMEYENLLKLIKAVSDSELTDFEYEEQDTKIRMRKKKETVLVGDKTLQSNMMTDSVVAHITDDSKGTSDDEAQRSNIVKSPLVGTFYCAPSEDSEPFVVVGSKVKKGQTLAIIEAMKLMNEIESDFDGEVAEIYVENGQAVEYGQPLFKII